MLTVRLPSDYFLRNPREKKCKPWYVPPNLLMISRWMGLPLKIVIQSNLVLSIENVSKNKQFVAVYYCTTRVGTSIKSFMKVVLSSTGILEKENLEFYP